MFGHRSDGRKIKTIDPLFRVIPCIMKERCDAQVFFKEQIPLAKIDEYIKKKAAEGIKISTMHVVYAAIIRTIAQRPQLNRFVVNGRIFARNDIQASLAIKKSLTDDGEETNLKLHYTGNETIFEIKDKLEGAITENKDTDASNSTDKLVKLLNFIPGGLIRGIVNFLMWLDKHGCLPKAILEASPFHTSVYLTNVGSLGIDAIYHHIYNFGTTSLFFAMGKKKKQLIYEDEELKEEKCITIGFVGDERICDGYYFASSFKYLTKLLKNPELLEERVEAKKDIP